MGRGACLMLKGGGGGWEVEEVCGPGRFVGGAATQYRRRQQAGQACKLLFFDDF